MRRHHQHASSRTRLGTVIVGIALSLMAFGMSPSQAATTAPHTAVHAGPRSAPAAPIALRCGPGVNLRIADRCAYTGPQQFSEGGCGFLQRCVWFSRSEQQYILTGGKYVIQAALCAASFGLGCVVAGTIVEIAFEWLKSRGGICSTSKPKLQVQYLPWPGVEGCVA
jgi:hypothetical protein